MRLCPETTFELSPTQQVPTRLCSQLFHQFRKVDFVASQCTNVLAPFIREDPALEELFDVDAVANGGGLASRRLLYGGYGSRRSWSAEISSPRVGRRVTFRVPPSQVATLSELVRSALTAEPDAFHARWDEAAPKEILDLLTGSAKQHRGADPGSWGSFERNGIMRREHASLLFRCDDSSILLDPQGSRRAWSSAGGRYPVDEAMPMHVDAILITHSHEDHWHLPSLLRYRADRLVVPQVPKPSLLCPTTFSDVLRPAGVVHEVRQWWSTLRVGAFEVDVLPFFGEQPVRDPPWPTPSLRSWGNCYRVNCPSYSAIVLVDSGQDPSGSVIDVLRESVARRGPVDFLFSTSFEFPEVIFDGLPQYFLTVPWGRVQSTWAKMKRRESISSITLGLPGIREACEVSGARFWAPYGQGFRGIGKEPYSAEARNASEAKAVQGLGRLLAERKLATHVVPWRPGDALIADAGRQVSVQKIAKSS